MGLAALVGLAVTIPFTIWIGYSRGAFTTGWLFRGGPDVPYSYIVKAIRSEPGIEWGKLQWAGIGAGLMTLVTLLHHRFAWWPLHPLGLAVGGIYKVRWCFLPFFVGWLAKTVIMRVSGAAGLRRAAPFFLGAMTGWFAGAALSIVVDAVRSLTPMVAGYDQVVRAVRRKREGGRGGPLRGAEDGRVVREVPDGSLVDGIVVVSNTARWIPRQRQVIEPSQ